MMALNLQVECTLLKVFSGLSMSTKWLMLEESSFSGSLIISQCSMANMTAIFKKLEPLENILLKFGKPQA
jgi:hypothetical protein